MMFRMGVSISREWRIKYMTQLESIVRLHCPLHTL
jgi:hypothetical protein